MEHFVKYRNWYYLGTSILFVLIAASTSPCTNLIGIPMAKYIWISGKCCFTESRPTLSYSTIKDL